jgi:modulator of FtsH protease HflC
MFNLARGYILGFAALVTAFFVATSIVIVEEGKQALVFEFGKVVRELRKPGISFKIPIFQTASYYESRLFSIPLEARELTAADSKRLIVDAFAYLKISNPTLFYRAVLSPANAVVMVRSRLESALRKVIGKHPLMSLLSSARGEIMQEIASMLNVEVSGLGMQVADVRISRADLPHENSAAICKRMQTAREQEAKKIRAEGSAEAARIMSEADKIRKVIIAGAYSQGELIRGQGEAKAAEICNRVYSRDLEFFKFYRTMKAYEKSFAGKDTQMLLSPSGDFIKGLKLGTTK